MEAVVYTLRTFNITYSFECVILLVISFCPMCGPDLKMFIYTDNICNQELFQNLLPLFETRYETLCTQLVEKVCNIKYGVCKNLSVYFVIQFPSVAFPSTHQLFLIFVGTGFEVLTVVKIHNAVSVRTPCIVWYMGINVLEEHSGSVFTGC